MPSLPKAFLEQISDEYGLTEFERDVFIARLSDMYKTDIVVAQELNISRDRYSSRMTRVYTKFRLEGAGPNKSYILFLQLLDIYERRNPKTANHVTQEALNFLLEKVNEKLAPFIQRSCGTIRVLDMDYSIDISDIYTEVKVLNRVVSRRFVNLSDFLENFNFHLHDSFSVGLSHTPAARRSGIDYVQKKQKLFILGKPGSGKTTFLKYLAINCNRNGKFPEHIPFFISIRYFSENRHKISLLEYLIEEYKPLNIEQEEIEKLLNNGKVFCLFDGLDEIRESRKDYVLNELHNFAKIYSKNRFIITCRIAAQEYVFDDFSEIEIADFNDNQIKQFAKNWFSAISTDVDRGINAQSFINRIEKENRIHELATNPLLLTLLCLVFNDSGDFPANRAELYEEGLDILLKKWDSKRNIEREQVYKRLSKQRKENLLSYIAYLTFSDNRYFFKRKTIEEYIRNYITNLPDASNDSEILDLDSRGILKSIEAQHGLLIERAQGIYSFSHLTFHEYFTALKITSNSDPSAQEEAISELVSHVSDSRWREVILLVVGISERTDYFLTRIKKHIDGILKDEQLEPFKNWLKTYFGSTNLKVNNLAHFRTFYFCLACMDLELQAVNPGENIELQIDYDLIISLDLAKAIYANLEQFEFITNVTAFNEAIIKMKKSCELLRQSLDQVLKHVSDPNLVDLLQEHIQQLPESEHNIQEWWKNKGVAWIKHLRNILIEHKSIGHDWEFTFEQAIQIKQYFDASKLLYDCLMTDCYISREVRQSILKGWLRG
ncbi:MAG: NACHT domain-containing NTPase [Cyanothece sp. SIO1E1]|nr:NACHT domain-containing NTPase [Cyanothece sp. SIO1E1]